MTSAVCTACEPEPTSRLTSGARQLEVGEQPLVHRDVVVLAGVHEHDAGSAGARGEGAQQRRHLHEVGPRADDAGKRSARCAAIRSSAASPACRLAALRPDAAGGAAGRQPRPTVCSTALDRAPRAVGSQLRAAARSAPWRSSAADPAPCRRPSRTGSQRARPAPSSSRISRAIACTSLGSSACFSPRKPPAAGDCRGC